MKKCFLRDSSSGTWSLVKTLLQLQYFLVLETMKSDFYSFEHVQIIILVLQISMQSK